MDAGRIACPSCGASAATDAAACRYCGTRLATVACPKCFGTMFAGSSFCPHCGGRAARGGDGAAAGECPRCRSTLLQTIVGDAPLNVCEGCTGIWITTESFNRICADRESEAGALAVDSPSVRPVPRQETPGRLYVKCPVCRVMMNRVNFARISGVVVDVCKPHGLWLDHGEFRAIVEFIRGGGMERSRDLADSQRRQAEFMAQLDAGRGFDAASGGLPAILREDEDVMPGVMSVLGAVLRHLAR